MHAKQQLSPPRPRVRLSSFFVLGFLTACVPTPSRADSLDDAVRALARKAASVPQRDRRFYLDWQNHSSVTTEQSELLRESFADEISNENIASPQESGFRVLRVSLEETPALLVLIAFVPCANGEEIRIMEFPRAALVTAAATTTPLRLLKELLWRQREPILDAAEPVEEGDRQSLLLLLNREHISLYRRQTDHWELLDTQPIPASEKPVRDARGEIRFSFGRDKLNSVVLPGKTCDLELTEKIEVNCHPASPAWREGMLIASPCNQSVHRLMADLGDWSVADHLLLRNPSLPKTAPALSELDLPGPVLSISGGPGFTSTVATVFNLSSGNYEVYRITLACGY